MKNATFSINDTQHNNAHYWVSCWVSLFWALNFLIVMLSAAIQTPLKWVQTTNIRPGAKLSLSVIYESSQYDSICPWQAFPAYSNKHSREVRTFVNCRQKCFIILAPSLNATMLFLRHCQWYKIKKAWVFVPDKIFEGRLIFGNRRARIRHQCRKTTILRYHKCLINSGVEKWQHLNIG